MKKIFAIVAAFAVAGLIAVPTNACVDENGNPIEGVDCVGSPERSEKVDDHFAVDASVLDYGRVTELDRSYTKQIVISNNTNNDIIVDAAVEKYIEADGKSQELADWIAFVGGVAHFSVAKGATYTLGVRAVVPGDAVSGSQYALIKLADTNGYVVELIARLDVAGDDLKYDSEVSNAWIDPVRLDKNLNASATVKNTGSAGFTAAYQVKVKSFFGGEWKIVQETKAEVLPNKEHAFKDNSGLGFGVYNVEQRVTYVNSEGRMVESLVTRIVVNLPWWSLAIAGGVILLIIVAVVIAKKKGKKHDDELEEPKLAKKDVEKVAEEIEAEPVAEPEPVKEELAEESKPVAKPAMKPAVKPTVKPKPVKKIIKIQ